ncbi:helix-turn-helix transcriptional regulator [Corallococcus carmarthensis]|uniref:LuxR family transcriptional regulator n=1 Tax=Corallococcus carmarthensis TaxID=2316728 RepID=A0A3A8KE97_9BACT|nr:helix-turn-helix transcriptional regulator [Corallococcus carmarthensis]NOK19000.1 helix-turn-helix transcriptional regulator [Corallococcus carmarthensis]RKH00164.1 LuxR family transcriptional regulator [Corallococcus carmarthensis]
MRVKIQPGSMQGEQVLLDVMTALTSSLDLTEVFSESHRVLSRVLAADFGGLCVSRPGEPGQYDWPMVHDMPQVFFDRYPEISDECFVSAAVIQQPNIVLRDTEMLSRQEMWNSAMYAHCREMHMPVERVISVSLDMGLGWHSGFTLYRENRKAFSEQERAFLQRLTPILARTVRNCLMLGDLARQGDLLDQLFRHTGLESIVLSPPNTELMRTPHSTALLHRWFPDAPCGRFGLPQVLLEALERLSRSGQRMLSGQDVLTFRRPGKSLKVTFLPLPAHPGRTPWALLFQEVFHKVQLPTDWRKRLTPRELEVVERVLNGWDNQTIAEDMGSSLNTLKTHLKRVFVKLAVPSRSKLILLAQERSAEAEG